MQVDGKKYFFPEDGVQLVVIDGNHGKVIDRTSFKNAILQGIPAQIDNYVSNVQNKYVNEKNRTACVLEGGSAFPQSHFENLFFFIKSFVSDTENMILGLQQ